MAHSSENITNSINRALQSSSSPKLILTSRRNTTSLANIITLPTTEFDFNAGIRVNEVLPVVLADGLGA